MDETNCQVLVVDDNRTIRALLADYLSVAGFEVRTAVDGADALAMLRRWHPDLIVLDLAMPGMDGRSFREAQLRHQAIADIPVVVFSAGYDLRDQVEALRADAVVRKGSDPDELVRAMWQVVSTSA